MFPPGYPHSVIWLSRIDELPTLSVICAFKSCEGFRDVSMLLEPCRDNLDALIRCLHVDAALDRNRALNRARFLR